MLWSTAVIIGLLDASGFPSAAHATASGLDLTFQTRRSTGGASPLMVSDRPNDSFYTWLTWWPRRPIVRATMAELRLVVFCVRRLLESLGS
jgi:hypothetical protein